MKKTIEQIICDECKSEIEDPKCHFHICDYDICSTCLLKRFKHSLSLIPLAEKCEHCQGNKGEKEFYGYNNEYNWKLCEHCGVTGLKIYCLLKNNENYRKLKDELDEATKFHSSHQLIVEHPNFIKITEIENVVSLILQDLRDRKGVHSCFNLLTKITKCCPVKEENRGVIDEMVKDWLEWASAVKI